MFAFEMMPPPQIDDVVPPGGDMAMTDDKPSSGSKPQPANNKSVSTTANNSVVREGGDIFSSMGMFTETVSNPLLNSMQNNQKNMSPMENKDLELSQILNNLGDSSASGMWTQGTGFNSSVDWQDNLLRNTDDSNSVGMDTMWGSPSDDMITQAGDLPSSSWDKNTELDNVSRTDTSNVDKAGDKVGSSVDVGVDDRVDDGPVTDTWRSCAICLEEMADSDLMTHTSCGGTLCQSCLEV